MSGPVYVVMLSRWKYDDEGFDGGNDPVAAFRDRAAADAECERLRREALAELDRVERHHDESSEFDEADWKYEVVELRLPAAGGG